MDTDRYNRHIILPEIGAQGQQKLLQTSVLVIGAGGLGSPVLTYLGAAGIGTIGIVDNDVVSLSNLQRQILYTTAQIGQSKAEHAKQRIQQNNPDICVNIYPTRFSDQNAIQIAQNYHIIVDCTDNYAARYIINRASQQLNIPMVYGSISQFTGQVSVFNHQGSKSYAQLFPEPPQIDLNDPARLGVLGVLPGIIGSIQANEVIKIALNIPHVLSNKLFLFDAKTMQTNLINY